MLQPGSKITSTLVEGLGLVDVLAERPDTGCGCGNGAVAIVCEDAEKLDDVGSVVISSQRCVVIACTQAQQK